MHRQSKWSSAVFLIVSMLFVFPLNLYAQTDSQTSADDQGYKKYSIMHEYREDEEVYVPRKTSAKKLVTFPGAVLLTPLLFPYYYAATKEPEMKKSFADYWQWIHYKVPLDVALSEDVSVSSSVVTDLSSSGVSP